MRTSNYLKPYKKYSWRIEVKKRKVQLSFHMFHGYVSLIVNSLKLFYVGTEEPTEQDHLEKMVQKLHKDICKDHTEDKR